MASTPRLIVDGSGETDVNMDEPYRPSGLWAGFRDLLPFPRRSKGRRSDSESRKERNNLEIPNSIIRSDYRQHNSAIGHYRSPSASPVITAPSPDEILATVPHKPDNLERSITPPERGPLSSVLPHSHISNNLTSMNSLYQSGPSHQSMPENILETSQDASRPGSPPIASLLHSDLPILTGEVKIERGIKIVDGRYSDVYRGVWRNERVAIKAIRDVGNRNNANTHTKMKVLREIDIWWRLRHPNVLTCMGFMDVDFGKFGGIVSPWCNNGDAWTYLQKKPDLPRRAAIFRDVARGLQYLHEFDPIVVHGDLKPNNIVIDEKFTAKICDFGLARLVTRDGCETGMTPETPHGGTNCYLAYEIVAFDESPTTASDIHALGCVGFACLYSEVPYSRIRDQRSTNILSKIEDKEPPALRPDDLSDIMSEFWNLLQRCWKIKKEERPDAAHVVKYLEGNIRVEPPSQSGPVIALEPIHDDDDEHHLSINEEPKLDLNLPKGINTRDIPVPMLVHRLKDIPSRAIFESTYSTVWQVTLDDGEMVAAKCLRGQPELGVTARRKLRREVGTWWCLKHENIMPLLGIAYHDRFGISPVMISPWYSNGTVGDYLYSGISVSMSQKIKLFHGTAKGVHYLHNFDVTKIPADNDTNSLEKPKSCGIKLVHGDLKPSNVLIDDNGVAKLSDFGLLRLVRESATGMTTTSSNLGTIRYLSYELVSDEDEDEDEEPTKPTTASDVYSLACLGMEFIYGKPPHANIPDTAPHATFRIMKAIEKGEPPAVRPENCTGTVSGLWDLFEACWSKKPSKRPDAAAVCEFLDENREQLITELEG